ncbi:MAG: Uma2 family endonuclease [Cyanobacteria bacterium J06649_4]
MVGSPQSFRMTPAEYLAWEPKQALRYEYCNGNVFAMTGGTKGHNRLALNLYSALVDKVDACGCEINTSDVKVLVRQGNAYRYPDLIISCDERDKKETDFYQFPKLIVEVLSSSTANVDRDDKFQEYIQIPTLQEYVLISTKRMQVECFRRGEGRMWLYYAYTEKDSIYFESIGAEVSVEQLYTQVRLDKPDKLEDVEINK